jgi:hypothetical protein
MSAENPSQKSPNIAGMLASMTDPETFNPNYVLEVGNNITLTLGADALLIQGM